MKTCLICYLVKSSCSFAFGVRTRACSVGCPFQVMVCWVRWPGNRLGSYLLQAAAFWELQHCTAICLFWTLGFGLISAPPSWVKALIWLIPDLFLQPLLLQGESCLLCCTCIFCSVTSFQCGAAGRVDVSRHQHPGFNPDLRCCVCRVCTPFFPVIVWISTSCSGFLSHPKDVCVFWPLNCP